MTRGPLRPFGFASLRQPDACGAGASRLCGKQNADLTGSLQKSRRPQSAQKSRTLLRLCFAKLLVLLVGGPDDFVAGASRAHPTRPLRGGRITLVGEPDGFATGAFRQTELNCSTSGSASAGSSVRTPFSKLRFRSRDLLRPLRGSVATLLRATRRLQRGRIFRAHPSARQIGRAEIPLASVNDDTLEMHARTKHPLHRRPERRISVEVVPPVRSGVLRMDEPHRDPALHHPVQHFQERHHVTTTNIDVHILDVRSDSCDFHFAKAPRADLAAAPQFGLRPHPTRPFRGGRIALVGHPDRLRRQANVAIHNRFFACGTSPQMTTF